MDDHDETSEPGDPTHPDVCECPGCGKSTQWGWRQSLREEGERRQAAFRAVLGRLESGLGPRELEVFRQRFGRRLPAG